MKHFGSLFEGPLSCIKKKTWANLFEIEYTICLNYLLLYILTYIFSTLGLRINKSFES